MPYKCANEIYTDVFNKIYGIDTIELSILAFLVEATKSQWNYAAVIPKFVSQFIGYDSPIINEDGIFLEIFTYMTVN